MKRFVVATEAQGHQFDVVVEAETMSDAVKLVKEKHCEPRQVTVTPYPTWVEPLPEGTDPQDLYQMTHQVYGDCVDCEVVLFEHGEEKQNDWPWQHASADEGCYTNLCYPCAQKRLEKGEVCYYFKHYYRDAHHYGCDKCPVGDCKKARDSYYEGLGAVLKRALYHSKAPEKAVQHFLDNNEFGLAFETLQECGPTDDERDPRFANNMTEAAERMAKGWKSFK